MTLFGAWGQREVRKKDPEMKPRAMIGVAGFHGVTPEAQENFFEFAYNCGRRCPEFDFLLKIAIKREQFRARNNIVDMAIANGCEWLLMLDDDMIIPPDLFRRMVDRNKDVLGALYFQRGGAYHPVLMKRFNQKDGLMGIDFLQHHDPIIVNRGLHKLDGVIGGGCMLFKVDVFRKIPQPYFWIDGIVGTDVHVCNQFHDAGVDLWVDTTIELGHVGESQIITSRTVPQYNKNLGVLNEELWEDLRDYLDMDNQQLESECYKASENLARKERWNEQPRTTWEGVRDYYQSFGTWQVLNLGRFNLSYNQARDWAVNRVQESAREGSRIADFGAGAGYCSIPLARKGYKITAMDLARTPTLEFLRWRMKKHEVDLNIVEFETPVPPDLPQKVDGVLMISVFDHLWDPMGVLDWCGRNVVPGGWLLLDHYDNLPNEDEPQHLIKFDAHKMPMELKRRGWEVTPDNPILFLKKE